jgi:hypothetical protein
MPHLDITSIQDSHKVLRGSINAVKQFHLDNRTVKLLDDLTQDLPLIYNNYDGELTRNLMFTAVFKSVFKDYNKTPAYTEAFLTINKTDTFDPKLLAEDISTILYARLSEINRLAIQNLESVEGSYDQLVNKFIIYKNYAFICMITGCFTKGLKYLELYQNYQKLSRERYTYEAQQNG